MISTPFRSILQCHYFRLIVYEMIPENSRSTVSIASFLVYFSTYVIILQENIGILMENRRKAESKKQFLLFQWQLTRASAIL